MSTSGFSLGQLGWRATFSQQIDLEDLERSFPARVANVQRSGITVRLELGELHVPVPANTDPVAVGDWVLIDRETQRFTRTLERQSLLARMAAGDEQRVQPIAANLDTLFIVTSCNDDFNVSRLERYLAIAHEARIEPVIVLTKRDLCSNVDDLLSEVAAAAPTVAAIALNATQSDDAKELSSWLTPAATVAFVGSSGVGKSTLVNSLSGAALVTSDIREHDAKGRHTTTARQMIAMSGGTWLIDTPGMRELKIGAVEFGIRATFDDIEQLALQCKFRDCRHQGDIGCAIAAAIAAGALEERRLANYLKLQREARHATQSVREKREVARRWGKMHKTLQEQHRRDRGKS